MSIFLVAANTQNQAGGASQAERAALFWNETAGWGTVYLSPFQTAVNLRFGTTQVWQSHHLYPAGVGWAAVSRLTHGDQGRDDGRVVCERGAGAEPGREAGDDCGQPEHRATGARLQRQHVFCRGHCGGAGVRPGADGRRSGRRWKRI